MIHFGRSPDSLAGAFTFGGFGGVVGSELGIIVSATGVGAGRTGSGAGV